MNPFFTLFYYIFGIAAITFLTAVGVAAGMGALFAVIYLIAGIWRLGEYLKDKWKEKSK